MQSYAVYLSNCTQFVLAVITKLAVLPDLTSPANCGVSIILLYFPS